MLKKAGFLLLFFVVLVGCGTADQSEEEASQGNQGTGESTEEEEQMNEEESSNQELQSIIDQLSFKTGVTTENNQAVFNMALKNKSDQEIELSFSSGQQYEIIVTDPDNDEVVYKFSEDMMFTEAIENKTFDSNQTIEWEQTWDYQNGRKRVEAKEYNVKVELLPMAINQQNLDKTPFVKETSMEVPKSDEASTQATDEEVFRNIEVQGKNGQYTVTGEARVFEGVFHYTVEDGHFVYVEEQTVQTDGAPSWGEFEIEVNIDEEKLPANGVLSIVFYTYDAKSGKQAHHYQMTLDNFNN
ncbi:BsuPI-related putative proteinase inhibitor [Filobacillus milosensis]|nr:BsuPI-related putative proteinase inhibitor [Filobacillus milosensis]